jgi:glycerol uptake facilitator-like aquaporin
MLEERASYLFIFFIGFICGGVFAAWIVSKVRVIGK